MSAGRVRVCKLVRHGIIYEPERVNRLETTLEIKRLDYLQQCMCKYSVLESSAQNFGFPGEGNLAAKHTAKDPLISTRYFD